MPGCWDLGRRARAKSRHEAGQTVGTPHMPAARGADMSLSCSIWKAHGLSPGGNHRPHSRGRSGRGEACSHVTLPPATRLAVA